MSLSSIWNTIYPILIAILFFELIIIIHEGGHFVAARLMKIKVNEFSIGMGPKIFSFTKGATKYSLRWILFGGYCAMEGEDEDSEESGSFSKKSVGARLFVVAAGAVMNLILGFLIIVCIVSSGDLIGTPTVAKFDENAVSAASGLQAGDTIKSIDGMRVYTATDVETGLSRSPDGNVQWWSNETVRMSPWMLLLPCRNMRAGSLSIWISGSLERKKRPAAFCKAAAACSFPMCA